MEQAIAARRQAKRAIVTSMRGKENKLNLQIHQDIFVHIMLFNVLSRGAMLKNGSHLTPNFNECRHGDFALYSTR